MTEKGLREVVAADTMISDIDGEQGRLWYVGYDIADLAEHCSFEEVVYLLHNRKLPNRDELDELDEFLAEERELSPFLLRMMQTLAQQASPMSMLRTSVSAASAYDPDGWDDSPEAEYRKAMRLIAKTPTLIAAYHRLRTGQEVIPPNPKLPHAANFLWMLLGEEPDRRRRRRARHHVRALRRPHDERLHVHGAHHRVDALGHVQRHHGRHRRARRDRCTAARTRRP